MNSPSISCPDFRAERMPHRHYATLTTKDSEPMLPSPLHDNYLRHLEDTSTINLSCNFSLTSHTFPSQHSPSPSQALAPN